MAQDILQLNELQHKVEAVPEQEWVEAIKVHMGSSAVGTEGDPPFDVTSVRSQVLYINLRKVKKANSFCPASSFC